MKTKTTRSLLKHSAISALVLGFFIILATGSLEIFDLFDIGVNKEYL